MVMVREESLAGVMAEVYGRLTRRPGVLIGQGPWVLGNGLIGTIEAYLSSSPMLLLTDFSDASRLQLHAPYQQATGDYGSWDARRAFGGVTKQVMQATRSGQRGAGDAAWRSSTRLSGQPGPVAVLFARTRWPARSGPDSVPTLYPTRYYLPPPPPPADSARVAAAAEALLAAQKPVIIAGNGVRIAQAYEPLRALAEAAGLPVATTAAGKGTFAETHPLALGVFGTFGTRGGKRDGRRGRPGPRDRHQARPLRHRVGEPQAARSDAADLHPDRHRADATRRGPSRPSMCCSATRRSCCGSCVDAVGAHARPAGARRRGAGSPRWRAEKGYFDAPEYHADDAADPAAAGHRRIDAQPCRTMRSSPAMPARTAS